MAKPNVMKFLVQGLEYTTPVIPVRETIRNYNKSRREQIWTRDLTYEQFDWGDDWQQTATEEQLLWLEEEVDRLYDGTWIYLNGKPTYFNNYAYFWVQWYVLESGDYPTFMDTCLEVYRFSEICDKAKLCLGYTLLKGRRMGASSMAAAELLLCSLINRNAIEGIMSKTGTDAQEVFDFVVNAFQCLPVFLKPRTEGAESPKKSLIIKKQGGKITKDQKVAASREGLNNKITWGANALNTFDGRKLLRLIIDEAGKFTDISVESYLQVAAKCVQRGALTVGKIIMPTTVNAPKSGGLEYRGVWDGSDQAKMNEMGQTQTGLYRIFIPAYMGYVGYLDFDGTSIWDTPTPEQRAYLATVEECPNPNIGAKQFLEEKRKMYKNDEEKLAEEKRQSPFTPEEVFNAATIGCYFNSNEIDDQMEIIIAEMESQGLNVSEKTNDENGRRGWFVPVGGNKVRFIEDDNGMWFVNEFLPEDLQNLFVEKNGKIIPANTAYGAAGLDPFAHVQTENGSDACCVIRKRFNILDQANSGKPVAMFLGKPKNKKFFHEQIANGLRYYGVKVLGEMAPSDWLDYFNDENLEGYIICTTKANGDVVQGMYASPAQGREAHLTAMVESSYSDYNKIPFLRLLRDRKLFDPTNRNDFDACMADGYALLGLNEPYLKRVKKEVKKRKFFRKGKVVTH